MDTHLIPKHDNKNLAPVSVIIPCYRCSSTIKRAVESVALQSFRPSEVILIEDGSEDNTLSAVLDLKDIYGDWLIIEILPKNMGVASARNRGWALATYPYLAFLDSDDAWHPKKIEIQYQFMKSNSWIAMTGHGYKRLSDFNESLDWTILPITTHQISKFEILVSNRFITPSIMLKKNIPFRFTEGKRYMEDHFLWEKLILSDFPVVKISSPLAAIYKFSYGISGLSSNTRQMQLAEIDNYLELHRQKLISFPTMVTLIVFSILKVIKRILMIALLKLSSSIMKFYGKTSEKK